MSQHRALANPQHCMVRIAPRVIVCLLCIVFATNSAAIGQQNPDDTLTLKVQRLTEAMSETQKRLDELATRNGANAGTTRGLATTDGTNSFS